MGENKPIRLGSGLLYVMEFSGTIPQDEVIEVPENILGYVSGGATLSYKPTKQTIQDDLGFVSKVFITEEEAVLKSGVMTWNGTTLKKVCSTARITEDTENQTRVVKIGGVNNYDGQQYLIHFLHTDAKDGDIRITLVGSNEAGFEMAFVKDKETVINAEFKAQPQDGEGTLILYKEEDKTITSPLPAEKEVGFNA